MSTGEWPWEEWTGQYKKLFYDVMTSGRQVIGYCWPNAGHFIEMASGNTIPDYRIAFVRPSASQEFHDTKPVDWTIYPKTVFHKKVKKNGKRR